MSHRWIQVTAIAGSLFLQPFLATGAVHAKEIHVPADYKTIQEAITASRDGDTVIVAPGTYRQNIEFLERAITVRSADPTDPKIVSKTTIEGGELGSAINFWGKEGPTTVLAGFTIIGTASTDKSRARGLSFVGSSPIVVHCTLVDAYPSEKNAFLRFVDSQASILSSTVLILGQLKQQNLIEIDESAPLFEAFVAIDSNDDSKSVVIENSQRLRDRRRKLFQVHGLHVWGTSCRKHRNALIGQSVSDAPAPGWQSTVYDADGRPYVIYQGHSVRMNVEMLSRFVDYEGDGVMSWPYTSELEWLMTPLNPGQMGTFLFDKIDPSLLPKEFNTRKKRSD